MRKYASPPVFFFRLWHVYTNSEDLASAPSLSTQMNEKFLSWLLNITRRNFRMSRGGHLILDGNPKRYELAENIDRKVEVNPQMLLISKNGKSIWSMNPRANVEKSVVGYMGILVALVRIKIGQGYYKSGRFVERPSTSNFISICLVWK